MEIALKLFPFFVFCFMYVAAKLPCPEYSKCLRSGPAIKFPFRLPNQTGPSSCGYPGFDLISCGASNETTIHLNSIPFIVRRIDYKSQEIRINDPDHFLPGKILSLNLDFPGMPFRAALYEGFTFFSCSSGQILRPELKPISCLSNSTHSVYATSSSPPSGECDVMKKVYVPVQTPSFDGDVPSSFLFKDIVLHWDSPRCHHCEEESGQCGLKDGPGLKIGCFYDDRDKKDRALALESLWFAISLFLFVFVAGLGLIFVLCAQEMRAARDRARFAYQGSGPKSEVGDSSTSVSIPDGPGCSICMSGFRIGEAPKTLNPCQHSFHAQCIDKWLYQGNSCPQCRLNHKAKKAIALAPTEIGPNAHYK